MKSNVLTWVSQKVAIVLLLAGVSCDDEVRPLNDDDGNANEDTTTFTWAATADSLQATTYDTYLYTEGTFRQDNQGNTTFHYWWNAHMLDALMDGYNRTGDDSYLPKMKALLTGIETMHGGQYQNVFNDDMQWLGIACTRAYQATDDPQYLTVAWLLWDEIKKSWSDVFGGGITWRSDRPYGKNATSNGPAAILAMRLYEIEGNPDDLEWAEKIVAWEKATLVDPATGLVWDNISQEGGESIINKDWIFTYNQGTYIGAALELYEETQNAMYLNDAVKTARSVTSSPEVTSEGLLRDEGQGDGGLFKGILVRYFTRLILEPDLSENDRRNFVRFMQFNAETFYERGIHRPAMLGSSNWREQPGATTDLSTQLSGVMLMEAAVRLAEADLL